ncbi:MAG: hypothetical protein NZ992_03555 [Candidatus Korarchaeum sp.]|nr:hypothetical protein [Candidatus Korarchaeum sp.]MDW8035617.1 hypothetical protein [Candidatus Korarchaeum sp.]
MYYRNPIKMVEVVGDQIGLAVKELEKLSEFREEALRRSRKWLSIARSSILDARRMKNLNDIERNLMEILEEVKLFLSEVETKLGPSSCLVRYALQDPLQELVEGIALCRLLMGEGVPSHVELGIGAREYLLGVSDAVGELRRVALDCMKRGDFERAESLVELMERIYEGMSSTAFPDSLIPLRKKVDEARILIEKTLSELIFVKAGRRGGSGGSEG